MGTSIGSKGGGLFISNIIAALIDLNAGQNRNFY